MALWLRVQRGPSQTDEPAHQAQGPRRPQASKLAALGRQRHWRSRSLALGDGWSSDLVGMARAVVGSVGLLRGIVKLRFTLTGACEGPMAQSRSCSTPPSSAPSPPPPSSAAAAPPGNADVRTTLRTAKSAGSMRRQLAPAQANARWRAPPKRASRIAGPAWPAWPASSSPAMRKGYRRWATRLGREQRKGGSTVCPKAERSGKRQGKADRRNGLKVRVMVVVVPGGGGRGRGEGRKKRRRWRRMEVVITRRQRAQTSWAETRRVCSSRWRRMASRSS